MALSPTKVTLPPNLVFQAYILPSSDPMERKSNVAVPKIPISANPDRQSPEGEKVLSIVQLPTTRV